MANYTEPLDYNKYQNEESESPCPNGLVGIFDCHGNLTACLTPNDAEKYKNATLEVAEDKVKVYHPTTGEYLGAMSADDACKVLECVTGSPYQKDFSLVLPTADLSGIVNFAETAVSEASSDFYFQVDRNNCFEDVVLTITSADNITFKNAATSVSILAGQSSYLTNLEWSGLLAGQYLFKVSFVACGKTKEMNCKLTLS